jgi:hypothetical protein
MKNVVLSPMLSKSCPLSQLSTVLFFGRISSSRTRRFGGENSRLRPSVIPIIFVIQGKEISNGEVWATYH